MRALLALVALLACTRPVREAPTPADPHYAAARVLSLAGLEERRAAVKGRDDLDAVDERLALELAWRNRAPAQVGDDLDDVPADLLDRERALRLAWRQEHVAWSWDNLDPDAQLEPRPATLSLGWLVLASHLPEARNGWTWTEPWIDDYYQRKRWYVPRDGTKTLSYMDQVQISRALAELDEIPEDTLRHHLASLPGPGMSEAEAALERRLAQDLLAGRGATP